MKAPSCPLRWKPLKSLLPLLFGLGLWQGIALLVEALRGVPFPGPAECFAALCGLLAGELFLDHSIWEHLAESCLRWGQGAGIALLSGLLYAIAALRWPFLRMLSMPTVEVLQLIPGLAWVPVVILLFGLNQASSVAIIVLTTFPVIAISGVTGFLHVDERYVRAGRMYGYGWRGLLFTVYLPAALPVLLSAFRIALGTSWRVLVAAEMVIGSGVGLGYAVIQSRWTMDYVSAFVCIAVIALVGLALERLVLLPLERRTLCRWKGER